MRVMVEKGSFYDFEKNKNIMNYSSCKSATVWGDIFVVCDGDWDNLRIVRMLRN